MRGPRIAEVTDGPSRNSATGSDDTRKTVTLVGDDEQDASAGRIGWSSPMARALRGAAVGDLRRVQLPGGEKEWEVVVITYG